MKSLKEQFLEDPKFLKILSQARSPEERQKIQSVVSSLIGPLWSSMEDLLKDVENNPEKLEQIREDMNQIISQKFEK